MAGPRPEKVAVIEEVRGQLEQADATILTEYRGLKVGDLASLRRALRGVGADYKIYKNTLVRRATAEAGQSGMDALLEGPTGIAFVETDVAAVAKVLRDFARTNPALIVKGSFVGGSVLDAKTTAALADLPSRETLLSQIAGALAAPMQQMAALLKALPQNLAYGISAVIDQKRDAGDTSGDVAVAAGDVAGAAGDSAASAAASGETDASADGTAAADTSASTAPPSEEGAETADAGEGAATSSAAAAPAATGEPANGENAE